MKIIFFTKLTIALLLFMPILNFAQVKRGYYYNNKINSSGSDNIYSFNLLRGSVLNKKIIGIAEDKNGNPISKTYIKLLDNNGNLIDTMTTKEDGAYSFLINSDKNFTLLCDKETYSEGNIIINTFGNDIILKANVILLKQKKSVIRKKKLVADLEKTIESNTIYFDLGNNSIRPDAEIKLDKIIKIMNENPDIIVELNSYTDCRESMERNQILSDERAVSTIAYIKKRITTPERIFGKGCGETNLVNRCACEGDIKSTCSEAQHQQNRRTEFAIVKKCQ